MVEETYPESIRSAVGIGFNRLVSIACPLFGRAAGLSNRTGPSGHNDILKPLGAGIIDVCARLVPLLSIAAPIITGRPPFLSPLETFGALAAYNTGVNIGDGAVKGVQFVAQAVNNELTRRRAQIVSK